MVACSAASRFLNALVRKDPVEQARASAPAQLQVQQPPPAVFGVPCTRHASILPEHLDRVLECRGGLVLGPLDRGLEPHQAWRPPPELEIVHPADINSGAVETNVTKNRRKGQ